MTSIPPFNPLQFLARPRRTEAGVRFVDKPTGRRRARAAANKAELRRLEIGNRLGASGTSREIKIVEIDTKTGEQVDIPATLDRRTGQYTAYTLSPSGLLIQDAQTPSVSKIILPGQEESSSASRLILPDELDNAPRSIALKGDIIPPKFITLGEECPLGYEEANQILMNLADQQRQAAQNAAKGNNRKPTRKWNA